MAARYRVFIGVPSTKALTEQRNPPSQSAREFRWHTVSSSEKSRSSSHSEPSLLRRATLPPLLEPHELSSASQNISKIYRGAIDGNEDKNSTWIESWDGDDTTGVTIELSIDQSISFIPRNDASTGEPATPRDTSVGNQESFHSGAGESYMTESGSSFAIFPNFHFNLHDITPLGKLCGERPAARAEWPTQKFSVLVAVIEVFGLDIVKVKKGAASGTEVAVISFVIGDHTGAIVKLTAWRETAEHFDGSDEDNPQIKKGDVVCFKDVVLAPGPSVSLNASPNHQSTHEICYRSLPIVPADRRFTPDLKLGRSDAVVRHVAQIVEWVIMMAGLPLP